MAFLHSPHFSFCIVPRFQENSFVSIVYILFHDVDIVDANVMVCGSAWSLIADSLLLRLPGLCSLPREFHGLFYFSISEIARPALNSVNNAFRLDIVWVVFCKCFNRLKCCFYISSAEYILKSLRDACHVCQGSKGFRTRICILCLNCS